MKKLIALLIVFCTVICSFPVTVFADSSAPALTVESKKVLAGETFELSVNISNNPGICCFKIGFLYDTDALTLNSVSIGSDFPGQFVYKSNAVWLTSKDNTNNGQLLVLSFSVKENILGGNYPISLVFADKSICNYAEHPISFENIPGSVKVIPDVLGDIDLDGKVTAIDANYMMGILLGKIFPDATQFKHADLYTDNKITAADVNIVKRKILGKI